MTTKTGATTWRLFFFIMRGRDFFRFHAPQHFLYFFPLPQGQGLLRPTFGEERVTVGAETVFPSTKNHSSFFFLK